MEFSTESIINLLSSELNEIDNSMETLIDLTTEITEIPAPPFKEEKRGIFIKNYFEDIGYETMTDGVGNIIATKDFSKKSCPIIVSAHLDTVFEDEEIEVVRKDDLLYAPGVGDDSRGLTNLLFISKLLFDKEFPNEIVYVATVGEEGRGDLRGVKYLFNSSETNEFHHPKLFISIDGSETERIVNQGLGSYRYRIHFHGPGGHSYGAFGDVNPSYALAKMISKMSEIKISNRSTTYSVGILGGGTSINSIPEHVWCDIDLRSDRPDELDHIDSLVKQYALDAVSEENELRNGTITHEFERVGNRPPGKLQEGSNIKQIIEIIHEYFGIRVNYTTSSTDANVPLSKNIPAIAIASIEKSGRAHSRDEWIDAGLSSLLPLKRNIILISAAASYL